MGVRYRMVAMGTMGLGYYSVVMLSYGVMRTKERVLYSGNGDY